MIKEVDLKEDWELVFPLMNQLYTHLTREYFHNITQVMAKEGYKLIGLYANDTLIAVAGYGILTNLYDGRHLWLYDLVVDSNERSKGCGQILLDYLHALAKEEGCKKIALCSRFDRTDAHRFYVDKMDYEKTSYVIKKSLEI